MQVIKKINIRGRQVPLTQLLSWDALQLSNKPHSDKVKVIAALNKFGSLTSRKLSTITRLERTNVTRLLKDLEDEKIVTVQKVERCPITDRMVGWYGIISDESNDLQQELF